MPSRFRLPLAEQRGAAWHWIVFGCGGALLLCILVVFAIGIIVYYGARHLVETYTDTNPKTMPVVQLSPEELEGVRTRIEQFRTALDNHQPARPLELTEREINAYLQNKSSGQPGAPELYVTIVGDQIRGDISVPLEELGIKGRYLNGSAGLTASIVDGYLDVRLQSIEVRGKTVPEEAMAGLQQENLAREAMTDPEIAPYLKQIERLEIREGKLIVEPKNRAEPLPAEAPADAA
ncbi:MAG: hypothetical protein HY706_15980 [Candidatus Hydrogenedentes bacterium]|nr:hypothetical protein [Candidatus Hydrogenedentota bacterium]